MTLSKKGRRLATGLAFLAPNILGFLAFTAIPLLISLVMAFSNWDLRLHNMFKDEPLRFVEGREWGPLDNFVRLFNEPHFWRFLGNTLFLMMGIPFAIAGSLLFAMLLSKDMTGGGRRTRIWMVCGAVLITSIVMLVLARAGATAMIILLGGLTGGILILGTTGGSTVYRTIFYLPHFTAGVAVFILWKHLYNPHTGPINQFLMPVLTNLTTLINNVPAGVVWFTMWASLAAALLLLAVGLRRLRQMWSDGELGWLAAMANTAMLLLPVTLGVRWMGLGLASVTVDIMAWTPLQMGAAGLAAGTVLLIGLQLVAAIRGPEFRCSLGTGFGGALMICLALMTILFVLVGLAIVFYHLPLLAAREQGITPPMWLHDYHWAKPSLMIMAFWAAIGSNSMLLYLAGLSNVPQELHEAADIDGASRFAKFWHVTWPQLAPTTFFIVVMSVIGGLQGGFEMARTMTEGGPAGATTTLSYFIYTEGFETGRLGYSSAVAWTLFLMVFAVTMFNWKFGSRYVND